MPEAPAAPPAGGPQEAATPVEVPSLESLAHALYDAFWCALEREAFGEYKSAWAADDAPIREAWLRVAQTASDGASIAVKAVTDALAAERDRLRIADADLRRRLDDLASQWEGIFVHAGCARELRDALEADHA